LTGGSRPTQQQLWNGLGDAWSALGTLISGIGVWGLAGFGLDRLFGTWPVLFVIGAIMGNFAGIYLMYVKYLRDSGDSSGTGAPDVRAVAGWPNREAVKRNAS
jgi:F0F1-type ATP synthase assembly protein I